MYYFTLPTLTLPIPSRMHRRSRGVPRTRRSPLASSPTCLRMPLWTALRRLRLSHSRALWRTAPSGIRAWHRGLGLNCGLATPTLTAWLSRNSQTVLMRPTIICSPWVCVLLLVPGAAVRVRNIVCARENAMPCSGPRHILAPVQMLWKPDIQPIPHLLVHGCRGFGKIDEALLGGPFSAGDHKVFHPCAQPGFSKGDCTPHRYIAYVFSVGHSVNRVVFEEQGVSVL